MTTSGPRRPLVIERATDDGHGRAPANRGDPQRGDGTSHPPNRRRSGPGSRTTDAPRADARPRLRRESASVQRRWPGRRHHPATVPAGGWVRHRRSRWSSPRPVSPSRRPCAIVEPRFGRRFDEVRIHTDDRAADASRALDANAWAFGSHIAFGDGRFDPASRRGLWLLSHELAHTVQQSGAPGADIDPRWPSRPMLATAPRTWPRTRCWPVGPCPRSLAGRGSSASASRASIESTTTSG